MKRDGDDEKIKERRKKIVTSESEIEFERKYELNEVSRRRLLTRPHQTRIHLKNFETFFYFE